MKTPDISLTIHLLSMIVHADEALNSKGASTVDRDVFNGMLKLPGVAVLMSEYDRAAMLPVRRDGVNYK